MDALREWMKSDLDVITVGKSPFRKKALLPPPPPPPLHVRVCRQGQGFPGLTRRKAWDPLHSGYQQQQLLLLLLLLLLPATVFTVPVNFEKRSCRCGGVLILVYFGSTQITKLFCVMCGRGCSKMFTRVCCVLRCVGLRTVKYRVKRLVWRYCSGVCVPMSS